MTREQERMNQREVDEQWARDIPRSACWHMMHIPYQMGGDNDKRRYNRSESDIPAERHQASEKEV